MFKKQTVWLLTMLSLMIVLSVYYLNAPSEGDLAYIDSDPNGQDQMTSQSVDEMSGELSEELEEGEVISGEDSEQSDQMDTSSINSDEYFAAVRMEITNQRSLEKERLESIVGSSDASSDEKTEAYEAMKAIEEVEHKENILESTIKSMSDYDQVLVRNVSEDNIVVTVQADSLTKKEANEIIQHTKDEFGEVNIEVVYQPS
ncbi:SpoIIIAH-like family protein [Gracilibacillus sp. YIM 98692]|uniref:SpoIIIAH-like family protein n=1 Tax=Gracilibacillus sp. YIM 98692 TaxID=2663532 RepID=UPI0013D263D2|nr:SpoIIIAH-like family protein [Gracilibacillus sp. YIM 98692]